MRSLLVSAVCGIGLKRPNNEDNLCINSTFLEVDQVEATKNEVYEYTGRIEGPLLASVCDGIGGESAGETASHMAVSRLSSLSLPAGADEIFALLRRINSEIVREAKNIGAARIGCTTAVLSVSNESATVINVGDSRVYRLRKRSLEQLSHDQSEVQSYVDAGILSEKKARTHPLRHRILQFLGMPEDMLQFEPPGRTDVAPGDVFLVCSDGLTECVEDRKIRSLLKSGAGARELYDAAMKKGGVDNTTVIVVRVE